jgi:hypothetical protein
VEVNDDEADDNVDDENNITIIARQSRNIMMVPPRRIAGETMAGYLEVLFFSKFSVWPLECSIYTRRGGNDDVVINGCHNNTRWFNGRRNSTLSMPLSRSTYDNSGTTTNTKSPFLQLEVRNR